MADDAVPEVPGVVGAGFVVTKTVENLKPIIQQIMDGVKLLLGGAGSFSMLLKPNQQPGWVTLLQEHGVQLSLGTPLEIDYTLADDQLSITLVNPAPRVDWKMFHTSIPTITISLDEIFVETASGLVPDLRLIAG